MSSQGGAGAREVRNRILRDGPIRHTTETELQDVIEHRLRQRPRYPLSVKREHLLDDHNRIDFLAHTLLILGDAPMVLVRVGIEVKIGSALAAVTRQLERYAQFDDVDELLLVTTKAIHHRIPSELNGKPVVLCSLVEVGL